MIPVVPRTVHFIREMQDRFKGLRRRINVSDGDILCFCRGEFVAVGRFQVMATLQAARAYVLGLPLDLSMSWGLNRAIFYATAKRGFKEKVVKERRKGLEEKPLLEEKDVYFLGDEMAYKAEDGGTTYFTIGGEMQKVKDFEKQIESRFKG